MVMVTHATYWHISVVGYQRERRLIPSSSLRAMTTTNSDDGDGEDDEDKGREEQKERMLDS